MFCGSTTEGSIGMSEVSTKNTLAAHIKLQPGQQTSRRSYCSFCGYDHIFPLRLTRDAFMEMREVGLIPDGPEDVIPGPFLFCDNRCALEFFWRRYQIGRLRGDLKRKRAPSPGQPVYMKSDGTITTDGKISSTPIGTVISSESQSDGSMLVSISQGQNIIQATHL
jgi:hypothetical protein